MPISAAHDHLGEAPDSSAKAPSAFTGLCRPRRPIRVSASMIGKPTRKMHTRYMMTKAPPPYMPVM
ncbi:hypothetical protein D3C72_1990100 [compost metagenome]